MQVYVLAVYVGTFVGGAFFLHPTRKLSSQRTVSTGKAFDIAAGRWRDHQMQGSTGALEISVGFLQAPYTQAMLGFEFRVSCKLERTQHPRYVSRLCCSSAVVKKYLPREVSVLSP